MPGWYFEKPELRNTPSVLDGIDFNTELRYRNEGARFIINTGTKMDLGYNTVATGVVYFHRFYMFHSFKQFPRYVTACCCLLLAGKVEETPKKCKDIIKMARNVLSDQKFNTFGDDPKEEVITLERVLLQTIKFDLQIDHPYQFLLKYAKCLKGDKTKLQRMVQMAWTFINDSLCTTLCLQWEPEIVAIALMYLAGKLSRFEATDWSGKTAKHFRWWDAFVEDITMDLLEDICHQLLDLYSKPSDKIPSESPPSKNQSKIPQASLAPPSLHSNGNEKLTPPPEHTSTVVTMSTVVPPSINPAATVSLPTDIPQFPYQTFTHAPPPLTTYGAFPASTVNPPPPPPQFSSANHLTVPPPHITAPPPNVYPPPFVSHPPPFPPSIPPPNGPLPPPPPSSYYGNGIGGAPPPQHSKRLMDYPINHH